LQKWRLKTGVGIEKRKFACRCVRQISEGNLTVLSFSYLFHRVKKCFKANSIYTRYRAYITTLKSNMTLGFYHEHQENNSSANCDFGHVTCTMQV